MPNNPSQLASPRQNCAPTYNTSLLQSLAVMRLETSLLGYDRYEPWDRPDLRSNKKIRPKYRPLPPTVVTCWEVNAASASHPDQQVVCCSPCDLFAQEKHLRPHLRALSSNKNTSTPSNVPIRFRCDTPWSVRHCTGTPRNKRKPETPPAAAAMPNVATGSAPTPSPNKKTRATRSSHLRTEVPVPIVARTTLQAPPRTNASDSFTSYLLERISTQTEAIEELGNKNDSLHALNTKLFEQNDWLHANQAGLLKMCSDIEEKKQESHVQVAHLKALLTQNVASLTAEFATVSASLANQGERDAHYGLAELQLEKNLVVQLKAELELAKVTNVPIPESLDGLAASIEQIVNCTSKKGTHLATKVKVICESILTTVFDGQCLPYLMDRTFRMIQGENPYRRAIEIAKIIDLSGSLINLSAYDTLRKGIEGDASGKVERNGGWLASKYHVMKCMTAVETAAQEHIPIKKDLELPANVDGVQFEYEPLLAYLLKLYKLDDVARDPNELPVEFSITLDGADLSRNISHVTAGIKINDPRAIDPKSGIPIGQDHSMPVQSRELCYPFKILIAKDTKELYNTCFADFFAFFQQVEVAGFGEFTKPFNVSAPQDMSSFWKSLKKGGGCKTKTMFCHCCSCPKEQVHLERPTRCQRCVEKNSVKCFHWAVGDTPTLALASERLLSMSINHPYLADATIKAKLHVRLQENQLDATRDIGNILYEPENLQERRRFSEEFLNHDLRILGLPIIGNLEARRARLLAVLRTFDEATLIEGALEHGNYAGAFIGIRQAVPCILHLENRCGEKKLKMLFLEGYDKLATNKEKQELLKNIEKLVNTKILGSTRRPANWRLATATDKDSRQVIKDQTIPNSHVRKFMKAHKLITKLCLPLETDNERRNQWDETFELWNELMEVAKKRDYFEIQDVHEFQDQADEWFLKWHALHGRDGMTNYIHMISSGHLAFYLKEWGNLWKYSQQGWESLNSLMKSVYYRRTQRGGHGGKKDVANSRVLPIARWLQRKLYFLSGDYLKCHPNYSDGIERNDQHGD
jgi:hypothetical protein